MIENVTIVGMGALGILYGDLMERTLGPGHVRFIAEGERLTRLQQEGAWCNGRKCDFTVTDNTGEEAGLLLFAVKMTAPETRRSERHDDRRHARGEKGGGLPGRFGDAEGPV